MHTDRSPATPTAIKAAAALLQAGEIVAFPTETVYGLGADARNPSAIQKIFTAKNRPADNPLIVHIANREMLASIARDVPPAATAIMERFWPGPVSLVLPKHNSIPSETTAGLDTVVVRWPSHPVAHALIAAAGTPVAAPSANRSGHISPTTAAHVEIDLDGRIPLILDGGAIEYGLESTVVDCTTPSPLILRPGSITLEMLASILPDITIASVDADQRSPGMKYRHYSPNAPITLFLGSDTATEHAMRTHVIQSEHERNILITHSFEPKFGYRLPAAAEEAAPRLYETLRRADAERPDRILIQGYADVGVGRAIMNRLRTAAESVVEV